MNTIGNIIWFLFGGFLVALEYLISSILMMLTIVGIPFGFQTLKLAGLALWPFNKEVISTPAAEGCLSLIMNGSVDLFGRHLDLHYPPYFRPPFHHYDHWYSICKATRETGPTCICAFRITSSS